MLTQQSVDGEKNIDIFMKKMWRSAKLLDKPRENGNPRGKCL